MAVSLELRSPLLDHRVVELGLALPPALAAGKTALAQAFAADLPAETNARPKTGFGVPLDSWFRNELAGTAAELLLGGPDRGLFRARHARAAPARARERHADHGHRLWCLCMLELWQRRYLDVGAPACSPRPDSGRCPPRAPACRRRVRRCRARRASGDRPPRSARCSEARESARSRDCGPACPSRRPGPGRSRARASPRPARRRRRDGRAAPSRRRGRDRSSPPIAAAITGRARSIASSATIPKPSPSEGTTTASDSSTARCTGVTWPRNRTEPFSSSSRVRSFSPCSSTPRPAISRVASGRASSTFRNARSSTDVSLDRDQAADAEEPRCGARVRRRRRRGRDPVVDDLEVGLRETPRSPRGSGRGRARSRSDGGRERRSSGRRARRGDPRGTR